MSPARRARLSVCLTACLTVCLSVYLSVAHTRTHPQATYMDMIVVVGQDCNEPKHMYKALGFTDFYDMFNFNLGSARSLAEVLRRQLALTPAAGVWSVESTHGHMQLLLAAATHNMPHSSMSRGELEARRHAGFVPVLPNKVVPITPIRTGHGHVMTRTGIDIGHAHWQGSW